MFIVDSRAAISGNNMARPPGQDWSEGRVVRLSDLVGSYSPRAVRVDEDHVLALAEVLDRLPPVVVDQRTMKVIDGVHRVEASRRLGRTEIRALLFSGSETEALVVAVQANVRHGKPLTRSERQAAAGNLLRRCPDRSDRWVAEVCGLSHSTVARIRKAAEALGPGVRTGRDGRRRPVDPAAGRRAIVKALAEGPASSFRQVAEAAGVAPSTVHRASAGLRGLRGELPERVRIVRTPWSFGHWGSSTGHWGSGPGGCPAGPHLRSCRRAQAKGANLLGIGRSLGEAGPGLPTGQVGPRALGPRR